MSGPVRACVLSAVEIWGNRFQSYMYSTCMGGMFIRVDDRGKFSQSVRQCSQAVIWNLLISRSRPALTPLRRLSVRLCRSRSNTSTEH